MTYSEDYNNYASARSQYYLEDKFSLETPWGFRNYIRESVVLKTIYRRKFHKVLDLGCASGHTLFRIAKNFPDSILVGLDIGKDFIATATNYAKELNIKNVDFFEGSLENYATDQKYDLILLLEVIEHVINEEILLCNIKKLIATNGLLCITTPNLNGDGTLYGRLLRFIKVRRFIPATDFTMEGTIKHGDQHVREFSSTTLEEVMETYGFRKVFSSGLLVLDYPFNEYFYKGFRRIPFYLKTLEFIEVTISIYLMRFSRKYGRHLIYLFKLKD